MIAQKDALLKSLMMGYRIREDDFLNFLYDVIDKKVDDIYAGAVLILVSSNVDREVLLAVVGSLYDLCECKFVAKDAIDTCGTGGSGFPKLNISSAVSLLCRACGLNVAKHGNRSASGKVGSADVFFALGWPKNLSMDDCVRLYENVGFCFLFAPHFFPALAKFGRIRKALGVRTIFNLAGPLCNPFRVGWQMIGVSDKTIMRQYAEVLSSLGREGAILHSESGLDEADIFSRVKVLWIKEDKICEQLICFDDVVGNDVYKSLKKERIFCDGLQEAVGKFELLMDGKGDDEFKLIVAFNSAIVLLGKGRVKNIGEGIEIGMDMINSGELRKVWEKVLNGIDSLSG